jgi:hypothetical protein
MTLVPQKLTIFWILQRQNQDPILVESQPIYCFPPYDTPFK